MLEGGWCANVWHQARATYSIDIYAMSSRVHAVLSVKLAFADVRQSLLHLVVWQACALLLSLTRNTYSKFAVELCVRNASLDSA